MPGWNSLRKLVKAEMVQSVEDGRDEKAVEALRPRVESAQSDDELRAVWSEILALPIRPDFGFDEPNELETIKLLRQNSRQFSRSWNDDELLDKMHGAWLGRCAGCALGKPVERFMGVLNGMNSRERIKRYLLGIAPEEYPIRDYVPGYSPAQTETEATICPLSTREKIAFMESDDDIRYTVLNQIVMRRHGRDFSTWEVARAWMEHLPYQFVCTAETQAFRNLVLREDFHVAHHWGHAPEAGQNVDWNWIATHENPYREWIGAQIRADSFGYAAPGNPELAAEFAWRDARISHIKNGIYGEMMCAAMTAAAFATDDVREVVEAGLGEIPASSRLHFEMRRVVEICEKHDCNFANFEAVLDEIWARLGHLDSAHTINNAAIVVASLLLGQNNFHNAITLSVMGGWDTDCNGATVGSIVGAMLGANALPEFWTGRLNDTLNSQIIGYHPIAISECARRSFEIARAVMA